MKRDEFIVTIEGDGSIRVNNADARIADRTAYVTAETVEELQSTEGRQRAIEQAIGYVAARMVAAQNGFSYRGRKD